MYSGFFFFVNEGYNSFVLVGYILILVDLWFIWFYIFLNKKKDGKFNMVLDIDIMS